MTAAMETLVDEEHLVHFSNKANRPMSLQEELTELSQSDSPSPSRNKDVKDGKQVSTHSTEKMTAKQKNLSKKAKYTTQSKSNGQPKPTGFEEFYCEAPVSAHEYEDERCIYDEDRPAIFRIQEALNRYQQKRRLMIQRMHIFTQYLRYGGVNVSQKMFGGVSEQELKVMDKENIIIARSQADIEIDKMSLAIDFELVTKSFLSFFFPNYYSPDNLEMITTTTITIRNWLNYLLYHEVVPEYTANIKTAMKWCNMAEPELHKNQRLLSVAPGDFNKACSFLFGGYYFYRQQQQPSGIVALSSWEGNHIDKTSLTVDIATKVVKFGIACCGTDTQATRFIQLSNAGELSATPIRDIDGFEVLDILLPNDGVRTFYSQEGGSDLNPVGKIRAKAWRNPSEPAIDLEPGETLVDIRQMEEFEFLVEEKLLQFFYRGMKVVTTVWELNCGGLFFDEILNAYCSFYTPLLNDLMLDWRLPRQFNKKQEVADNERAENEAI